jgi:hypothetical protein
LATPRRPPSWRVWILSLGGAAVFVVAMVLFVNAEDETANQPARVTSRAAIVEQNREARIEVEQDQVPHVAALRGRLSGRSAMRSAVAGFMRRQVALGTFAGSVARSSCTPAAGATHSRLAFRCGVVVGNVTYPFLGVVDESSRQVTYCKRDVYPPVLGMNVPVSPRCT